MMYVPDGCVKIAGATVNRNDYIRLVNLANKYGLWTTDPVNNPGKFGVGNGTTTMVLPDWRGVVRRFLDEGKGYDANRVLGTFQGDAIRNITGAIIRVQTANSSAHPPASIATGVFKADTASYNTSSLITPTESYYTSLIFDAGKVVPTAPENRMRNIAEMAVMRY